jgi:hypothetical protein
MPSRVSFLIVFAALGALGITAAVLRWTARQSVEGTWLAETKTKALPDTMRIQISDGELRVSFLVPYSSPEGTETDALKLDGDQHSFPGTSRLFALTSDYGISSSYLAQSDRKTITIDERYDFPNQPEHVRSERWVLQDGGNRLVIVRGDGLTTYDRAPLSYYFGYHPL